MKIFYSPPKEISENGCWVCFANMRMFCGDTRLQLLWQVVKGYNNDKYIVG